MGQGDSKQIIACPYCASEIVVSDNKENGKTSNQSPSALASASPSRNSLSQDNNNNGNNDNEQKSNADFSQIIDIPPNAMLCQRCHGFYKKPTNSNQRRKMSLFGNDTSFNLNNNNNNNNDEYPPLSQRSSNGHSNASRYRRYIEHLHIAPFQDTLEQNEEKQISEEFIIDTYLKPFFNQNKNIPISAKTRIIIKNVEFKVFGCYPPNGIFF